MIKADARYFNNAHRISDVPLDSGVTALYDGQWLMFGTGATAGKLILHTGAANKRGYITLSSKYGDVGANIGRAITEDPAGRDNVTSTGFATVLAGTYRLATDQYETATYVPGAALKISANAKLTPWVKGTDLAEDIVGYVTVAPADSADVLTFIHE